MIRMTKPTIVDNIVHFDIIGEERMRTVIRGMAIPLKPGMTAHGLSIAIIGKMREAIEEVTDELGRTT